jgi:uncharacterized protein with PIN domain
MNDDLRTCDSILKWLKEQTENRNPISPHLYLEAATALNILSSNENDTLIDMESTLAVMKASAMSTEKTVAAAKVFIEALPEFGQVRKQRAKIEQIKEAIRIAKLTARLKSDELKNYV